MGQTRSAGGSLAIPEFGGKRWRKKIGWSDVSVHSTVMIAVMQNMIASHR